MFNYLDQHPQIFCPQRKEFNYFSTDLNFTHPTYHLTEQEYLQHFADWGSELVGGEASVWHLYSTVAAQKIREFSPDAKIIVMVRNPADMLFSLYYQLLSNGDEDLLDFESALRAEASRKHGRNIPNNISRSSPVEGLFYTEVGLLSVQIERYFRAFDPEQIKVIVYDDFAKDTLGIYRSVLAFLNVDQSFEPHIRIVNPNQMIKSRLLWRLVHFPPNWMRATWQTLLPVDLRSAVLRYVKNSNKQEAKRPPLKSETRQALSAFFAPEVKRLGQLIGRDLTDWTDT